ncbi:MAG TPA: hypothetical protein VFX44_02030 [Solirubrobacterales bacterium]|nr:hypothetical protein [Solirubrobacterales bacterium]
MAASEPEPDSAKHFHERWQFQAVAAVVALVAALWAFTGVPKPWELWSELTSEELPLRNTEIILDASRPMGDSFGKATKLAVAAEAVGRYAASGNEIGLALRRVGGSCAEEAPSPLVGFGTGHGKDVREEAEEQRPEGKANLTSAVRAAIGDFASEDFHRSGSENQIVIFAGNGDQCGELAGPEIRDELENANVHAVLKIFALGVSGRTLANLERLKRQLEGAASVQVRNAENVHQLYKAVAEESPAAEAREEAGQTTTEEERGGGEEGGASGESGVVGEG